MTILYFEKLFLFYFSAKVFSCSCLLVATVKHSSDIAYEMLDTLKEVSIREAGEFWESHMIGYLGGILKSLAYVPEVRAYLEKTLETLKKD